MQEYFCHECRHYSKITELVPTECPLCGQPGGKIINLVTGPAWLERLVGFLGRCDKNKLFPALGAILGAITGLLGGYPASYFCQGDFVRIVMSIGDYITHIGQILSARESAQPAIGVWLGCLVVCTLTGVLVGRLCSPGYAEQTPIAA